MFILYSTLYIYALGVQPLAQTGPGMHVQKEIQWNLPHDFTVSH